jgi:hypothetical protein
MGFWMLIQHQLQMKVGTSDSNGNYNILLMKIFLINSIPFIRFGGLRVQLLDNAKATVQDSNVLNCLRTLATRLLVIDSNDRISAIEALNWVIGGD